MALVVKDRVRETTTTTGTGTITLLGAVAGFQSFSVIGNANTTYYTITDTTAGTWEVGIGTYTASGTTLSRTTVLESSNAGALVNFAAGNKDVFVTYPAEVSVYASNSPTATYVLTAQGVGIPPVWAVAGGGGGISGTSYVYVAGNGTAAANGTALLAAYTAASALTPYGSALSATNRVAIVVGPGQYTTTGFTLSNQFVDLVSLTGNPDVFLSAISVTANDVYIRGMNLGTTAFTIASNLNLLKVEKCIGGAASFGHYGVIASGTFTDCTGGDGSFGEALASGTFTNCIGGGASFGGYDTASGKFTNCTGGSVSFGSGSTLSVASGTFVNCTGGDSSFAASSTASGTFVNCTGGSFSFGGDGGAASGTFTDCTSGEYSFGHGGTASGTFTNCKGVGWGSFGASGTASGIFTNCISEYNSFGTNASGTFVNCTGGDSSFANSGTASGIFTNCISGSSSFGGGGGTLTGKLFYCRITPGGGAFQTVSSGGRTYYCVDGDGNTNNQ